MHADAAHTSLRHSASSMPLLRVARVEVCVRVLGGGGGGGGGGGDRRHCFRASNCSTTPGRRFDSRRLSPAAAAARARAGLPARGGAPSAAAPPPPGQFQLEVDWIKAIPGGVEPEVVMVSCAGTARRGALGEAELARIVAAKRRGEEGLRLSGLGYTIVRPGGASGPPLLLRPPFVHLFIRPPMIHTFIRPLQLLVPQGAACERSSRLSRDSSPHYHPIIHHAITRFTTQMWPAGLLVDEPGGYKALVFDQGDRISQPISAADVADICLRSLHEPAARSKTFDVCYEASSVEGEALYELVSSAPAPASAGGSSYLAAAAAMLAKNT